MELVLFTRSELGDCTQQVVVDAGRSVLALAPAHRRRGRRRDQKLFGGLGRGQVRLVDVLTPTLDLGKVKFELLAVELGLVQLDASAGSGLGGAEVNPHSSKAFKHLESRLFIVDPKQRLEPLLYFV